MGLQQVPGEAGGNLQKALTAARVWWCTRVQRDLATLMMSLAVVDLSPYADDIHEFIPWKHWHAALRLVAAAGIYWRGSQIGRHTD